jgi:hypothetical protein
MTTNSPPSPGLPAGIYSAKQIPMAEYLADPCVVPSLSSGACHTILTRSLQHVWTDHPRLGGRVRDDSDASDIGTLMHDLLLGGEGKICVIEPSDYRSKPTKDEPDGAIPKGWTNNSIRMARDLARAKGLTPVLAGAIGAARQAVTVARDFLKRSELAGVLDDGAGEVTLLWQDGETWCRARPDWVNHEHKVMVHYKSTQASANPEPFCRLAVNMGYDVSLAFYRRGFEALTKDQDWQHVILAQEQAAPFACSLIGLDPAAWAIADEKVSRGLKLWRQALATDRWPAYSGKIHFATPTAWQLAEAEQRMQESDE